MCIRDSLEPENLPFAADLYATSDAELCEDCCESPEDIEAYEAEREKNLSLIHIWSSPSTRTSTAPIST